MEAVCGACDRPAKHGWVRLATAAELARFAADEGNPSVRAGDESATVPVYACDEDALEPDLLAIVHQANCKAPVGLCFCLVDTPNEEG